MDLQGPVFSIVVIGAMNPPIHHPYWYKTEGLISKEELESALSSNQSLFTQDVTQFSTGSIDFTCHPNRWEIKTPVEDATGRLVSTTRRLFDDVLPHTPIAALGFNYITLVDLGVPASACVAKALKHLPVALDEFDLVSGEFKLVSSGLNQRTTVSISPSPTTAVVVSMNVHHTFETQGEPVRFSLSDTLISFEAQKTLAQRHARAVATQLGRIS